MSELIDRNALIDALMTYTWRDEDERLIDDWDEKRKFLEDWLPSLPTIEAEPVRHGNWKRRRLRVTASCLYKCSACGHCVNTADIWAYKFCYHCGAKMDEVSE